jgi:hypothetical protein
MEKKDNLLEVPLLYFQNTVLLGAHEGGYNIDIRISKGRTRNEQKIVLAKFQRKRLLRRLRLYMTG